MKITILGNKYSIFVSKTANGDQYILTDLTGIPEIPAKGSDLWNLALKIKAQKCSLKTCETLFKQAKQPSWTVPATTIEDCPPQNGTGLMKLAKMAKRPISDQEILDSVNGVKAFALGGAAKAQTQNQQQTQQQAQSQNQQQTQTPPPGGYTAPKHTFVDDTNSESGEETVSGPNWKRIEQTLEKLNSFFKGDFNLMPENHRFISMIAGRPRDEIEDYIYNFFEVIKHPGRDDLKARFDPNNGREWAQIVQVLETMPRVETKINKHLSIYWGDPGIGKTFEAMKDPNVVAIPCNPTLDPESLMRHFDIKDSIQNLGLSQFAKDISSEKTYVFDEANFLPPATHVFLQGLFDNKPEFTWGDVKIPINPKFKVIMTMNLYSATAGDLPGLPEALAARCGEFKYFGPSKEHRINMLKTLYPSMADQIK